jgi:hypothetical protein
MQSMRLIKTSLVLTLLTLLTAAAFAGPPMWSVQGVIDWSPFYYGSPNTVHKVYDEKWNLSGQSLPDHAAKDGFVFLPRDQDVDADVPFGTLAGAAALILVKPIDPDYIDWYRIWVWADVNANGAADNLDLIWEDANGNGKVDDGEMKKQNWQLLVQEAAAPGWYDTVSGEAQIGNLLKSGPIQLHAGMHYLLLLEVHGHIPPDENGRYDSDEGTSLQFSSPVRLASSDRIQVDYTPKLSTSGWDPADENLKYITKDGQPLTYNGQPSSRQTGVDNFEMLWLRVNDPPRGPRH